MKLERLKHTEIAALNSRTVVVIPTASIEQHGPHLPVGTDTMIGQGIIDSVDKACGSKLLVLPVQHLGCSEHHMGRKGTVTLLHDTYRGALLQQIDSMYRHGFRRFLISNSHGGNLAINGVVGEEASSRWPDAEIINITWFRFAADEIRDMVEGEYPSVGHACEFETSVMLVLHPDLVDMSKAVDDGIPPRVSQLENDLLRGGKASWSVPFHVQTKHGVIGKATLATKAKGEEILKRTTAAYKKFITDFWPDALG